MSLVLLLVATHGACVPESGVEGGELEQGLNERGGNAPIVVRAGYDYVPSLIYENGLYKMWWCGRTGEDDTILYAETNGAGPFSAPQVVFTPTHGTSFDSRHTCDPSVVKAHDGYYYMFYAACESGCPVTRIGVARSSNGRNWTRLNAGQAIVSPARGPGHPAWPGLPNHYGAGQPSVIYQSGYFLMIYTDSTGLASNPYNGAGQYVLASTDPTFQSNRLELVGPGLQNFAWSTPTNHTTYSMIEAFSVDWQYAPAIGHYAIALSRFPGRLSLAFERSDFSGISGFVDIPGDWTEGPGLLSLPDKTAMPGRSGMASFDMVRSVLNHGSPGCNPYEQPQPFSCWDLAWAGTDVPY